MARRGRRVYGYARVSGQEQGRSGTSLEAQQAAIADYCKAHKLGEPELFVEVESGAAEKRERRVEQRRILRAVREGDLILVTRVDRWSRDIVHAVQSVRELVAKGITWIAIHDSIDAATPQGDSMLGIMAWAADAERRRIAERTVGRRKQLRDAGFYVEGLAPVGYRREARTLVPVPEDAALVVEVFRRAADGEAIRAIQRWLRREHGDRHGWDRKTINVMLRSRTYLGEVKDSGGQWIEGRHPGIVDPSVWRKVQAGLDRRRLGGRPASSPRTESWLIRGLGRCALCGAIMTSAYGDRRGEKRNYYACANRVEKRRGEEGRCLAPYVPVELTDEHVAAATLAHLEELSDELSGPGPSQRDSATPLDREIATHQERRARLIDLAADGMLTKADLRERLTAVDADIARAERKRDAAVAAASAETPETRRTLLRDVKKIRRSWKRMPVSARREIVQLLADAVVLHRDHQPDVQWKPVSRVLIDT